MLQPEEIIRTLQDKNEDIQNKKASIGLIGGIIDDAKSFFSNLTFQTIKLITGNKYKVDVDFPKVQEVEGTVNLSNNEFSVSNLKEFSQELQSKIDELKLIQKEVVEAVKGIKQPDFSNLEKAVKSIDIPEVNIPETKDVSINNLPDFKKMFDELGKKLKFPDINIPEQKPVKIPDFPKEIKVSNFPKETKEPELLSFYWNKDDTGNMTEFVEVYSNGEVVSTGWNLGRVKISDKRN